MVEPGQLLECQIEICPGHTPRPGDVLVAISTVLEQRPERYAPWEVTFAAHGEVLEFEFDPRHASDLTGECGFLRVLARPVA